MLLREILGHLSSSDIVRLKMTGGGLCREDRFVDTVNLCLEEHHSEYLKRKEIEKHKKFMTDVSDLVITAENAMGIQNKVRTYNALYDYLVNNSWFMQVDLFHKFVDVAENKLIEAMVTRPQEFSHYGLYYMQRLFGIELQVRADEDTGELVEYIKSRDGRVITW